jgi:hypothetical protein
MDCFLFSVPAEKAFVIRKFVIIKPPCLLVTLFEKHYNYIQNIILKMKKWRKFMVIADLHIHSHYSMATSKNCTPEYLELWARRKGIGLLGTGDFTHPAWRGELKKN